VTNYSTSEENYIKAIYHLEKDGKVNTSAVAEYLQTKDASVTDMLKKLKAKKILDYKPYYGFQLNAEGKIQALKIIRRHRLWESFLSEKLAFSWEEVHEIAEQLEHINHPKLIDKLDQFLGFPPTDPHGDPIPDANGKIKEMTYQNLHQVPLQKQVIVSQVIDQSQAMLELLNHKEIGIGTTLVVRKRFEFDHSIEIEINNQMLTTISGELANNIYAK